MNATSARPCPRCGERLDGAGRCAACSARGASARSMPAARYNLPESTDLPGLPSLSGLPDLPGAPAELPPLPGLPDLPRAPARLPPLSVASDLPGLPELPGLPDADGAFELHGARGAGALAQAAASLASAWRGTPQELYGCKPFELDALVQEVLGDPAASANAPASGPNWTPDQLAERADFGLAPDGRLAAMPYALQVVRRRRELRAQAAVAVHDAEQARTRGRDALAQVGEAIFARREEAARGSLAQRVEAAVQALSRVDERKSAQTALGEEAAADLARHDAAIGAAERAAEPEQQAVARAEEQTARARRDAERATALHKRAEIEIRAAQSASEPSSQRIERAQADRQAREVELTRARDALASAERALAAAQDALAVHAAGIAALRAQRQAAADEHARKAGAAQGALGEASAEQRDALCALASAALRENLAPKASAETAVAAMRAAQAARNEAELTAAAIDAYDQDGYRAGLTTAGVLAAAMLALLVWLAM